MITLRPINKSGIQYFSNSLFLAVKATFRLSFREYKFKEIMSNYIIFVLRYLYFTENIIQLIM